MEYIGIDVHQRESQVCIVDEDGHVLLERSVRTRRERFAAFFEGRGRARVVLEASTESEWVAQALEALGHEVIVADPNFAPLYATRSRRVKTDRRVLARIRRSKKGGLPVYGLTTNTVTARAKPFRATGSSFSNRYTLPLSPINPTVRWSARI
jgi:transposase